MILFWFIGLVDVFRGDSSHREDKSLSVLALELNLRIRSVILSLFKFC